jgi:DeoR family ulaG and ulaABCDEF operon transcriptional repressor
MGLILCNLRQVHMVITDTGVDDVSVQWLEQAGIEVIKVAPEPLPRGFGAALAVSSFDPQGAFAYLS